LCQVNQGQHNQESYEREDRVVSYRRLVTDMKYNSTDNNNLHEAGKRSGTEFQNTEHLNSPKEIKIDQPKRI